MAETFKLKIITPDRIFYDGDVEMVEFNTTEGEIGIYKNHVPMTVIVSPGVLRLKEAEKEKKAALLAGFVEILQDEVKILAEKIEWPDEIVASRAESAAEKARARIARRTDDVDLDRDEAVLKRSLARIQTLKY